MRLRAALVIGLRLIYVAILVVVMIIVENHLPDAWWVIIVADFIFLWGALVLVFMPPVPWEMKLMGASAEDVRLMWPRKKSRGP